MLKTLMYVPISTYPNILLLTTSRLSWEIPLPGLLRQACLSVSIFFPLKLKSCCQTFFNHLAILPSLNMFLFKVSNDNKEYLLWWTES